MRLDVRLLKKMGLYSAMATEFTLVIAGGVVGGYYADRFLGTSPWLLVAGVTAGTMAGIFTLARMMKFYRTLDQDR